MSPSLQKAGLTKEGSCTTKATVLPLLAGRRRYQLRQFNAINYYTLRPASPIRA
ncbi:hypothetical protein [Penaeicola halotolerans]|uniref:hypothetical protein n=1 Tax=Penaeicola halotolerans TaxID=2793196 RepID=UPI001CF8B0D7|nr:hypothetical protein [Penaeicola halotolerans]